jgi:hypothetical protein
VRRSASNGNRATARMVERRSIAKSPEYKPVPQDPKSLALD